MLAANEQTVETFPHFTFLSEQDVLRIVAMKGTGLKSSRQDWIWQ